MQKKILTLLLCSALSVCAFSGCGDDKAEPEESSISTVALEEGKFDIDAVRNNISIKGHKFIVPQKLSQLDSGLKYKFVGEEFDDGLYEVEISDENDVILCSIAENAHNKSDKASLYNIALNDSDSNVLDITPQVSNKEDVVKLFGEPDATKETDIMDSKIVSFIYGFREETSGYRTKGKFMNISFNEDNIVSSVVINYVE